MRAAFPRIAMMLGAAVLFTFAATAGTAGRATAEEMDPNTCPMHAEHMAAAAPDGDPGHDHDAMNARGAKEMGFDQAKTVHHFILRPDGGEIAVDALSKEDADSRDRIRTHLKSIATAFGRGDFSIPAAVHAQTVPGTAAMTRLRSEIRYAYEETPAGARVRVSSGNANAIDAIHDFLRFQIAEHRTGDPAQVTR